MENDVLTEMLDMLPSMFDKSGDSNIAKIIAPFAEQLEINRQDLETLSDWQEIANAEGVFLDRIGQQYNEYRNNASDAFYRFKILTHIFSLSKNQSLNDLLSTIGSVFANGVANVEVTRTSSGGFTIDNMPADLISSDDEQDLLVQRIKELSAAGISIDAINFVISTSGLINYSTAISHTTIIPIYQEV